VPYAFLRDEPVPAAIRRIMDEQIARARDQLADASQPLATRVHDARKRLKETRAILRLVRRPLGEQFSAENAAFRDAGRMLAGLRDAEAVLEALEKLSESAALSQTVAGPVHALLVARRDAISAAALEAAVSDVLARLNIARARLDFWPPLDDSFETIAGGLRRTYGDGRRAMATALAGGMPAQYHDWRKRAKEHWYHAQLLRNVWLPMMKSWADELSTLSRALGDHHDLFVLRETVARVAANAGPGLDPVGTVALLDAIAARQTELEQEAQRAGRLAWAEPPQAWLARIRNLWAVWRS
jgi:CHAD domain-containing protein